MSEKPTRFGPGFNTWLRDDPEAREAILKGKEVEVVATAYAQNDFILEFLMGSGLWEILVSVRPGKLRKENGKPWKALNGLEVLRELIHVERIAHCGRVISDTRLMLIAGFNAEEIRRHRKRGGLLVDPETLGNPLARMNPPDVLNAFYRHVALLKKQKWIGRGIFAADAHEITFPHARGWGGMERVGNAYGYKLVLLAQVSPGGERIVGLALGPLQVSEHRLLQILLRQLEEKVCPMRTLIDVLVLDRGYWGAEFLLGLKKRYGFHFVTRAQHEGLGVVKDVEGLRRDAETAGPAKVIKEDRSRLGKIKVSLWGFEKMPLRNEDSKEVGQANVVVAEEYDEKGNRIQEPDGTIRPPLYYVTSLPAKADPYAIRKHYLLRWTIENQGFRNLTQRWSLDVAAGRNYRSILARTCFVLVLANAESILEEHFPGPWQEERKRLGKLGVPGLIGGEPALAAYTPRGQLGILSVEDYSSLIVNRERASFLEELRKAQARGEGIEDVIHRLGPSPLPPPRSGDPERK
jgi:hypothetical protein